MIERKEYMEDLIHLKDKDVIKVIMGIRRCGQSTLLSLFQKYLLNHGIMKEQIVYINFEDPDYRHLLDANSLYDYVNNLLVSDEMNYVFLDEIQQVKDFEKAADWLYLKKCGSLHNWI